MTLLLLGFNVGYRGQKVLDFRIYDIDDSLYFVFTTIRSQGMRSRQRGSHINFHFVTEHIRILC
jgi:hypothetical protein